MTETPAERLKRLRQQMQWSQTVLAQAAGISEKSVSRAERGEKVETETWLALAHALGVKVDELTSQPEAASNIEIITIGDGHAFFSVFSQCDGHIVQAEDTTDDASARVIRELLGWIETATLIWDDMSPDSRYDAERDVTDLIDELHFRGWGVACIRSIGPGTFGTVTVPEFSVGRLRVNDMKQLVRAASENPALLERLKTSSGMSAEEFDELWKASQDYSLTTALADAARRLKVRPRLLQEVFLTFPGAGDALDQRVTEGAEKLSTTPAVLLDVLETIMRSSPVARAS
jgi:transcriptional regulator with XRE-family HTH domain